MNNEQSLVSLQWKMCQFIFKFPLVLKKWKKRTNMPANLYLDGLTEMVILQTTARFWRMTSWSLLQERSSHRVDPWDPWHAQCIHVYNTRSIQDLPLILLKCQHGVCLLVAARCQGPCKYWQDSRIFDTGVLEKSLSLFVFVCVASAKDHW